MLFWILAAILTAAIVAILIRPLARPADTVDRAEFDLAVYRDQLAEIDRDVDRGLIGSAEAEAARTEIGRRALAADRLRKRGVGKKGPGGLTMLSIVVLVPAVALVAYLSTGSPELPSQPFAARDQAPNEALAADLAAAEELARQLQSEPADIDGWIELGRRYAMLQRWGEAAAAYARAVGLIGGVDPQPYLVGPAMLDDDTLAAVGDMTEEQRIAMIDGMVANLAARLEQEPDDVAGWMRLANAYRVLERPADAQAALMQAVANAPDELAVLSQLVDQLLVDWRGGPLPSGLLPALQRMIALAPDDFRALLFLGEAAASEGDVETARGYWAHLQTLLEPGSAEHDAVGERLDSLVTP